MSASASMLVESWAGSGKCWASGKSENTKTKSPSVAQNRPILSLFPGPAVAETFLPDSHTHWRSSSVGGSLLPGAIWYSNQCFLGFKLSRNWMLFLDGVTPGRSNPRLLVTSFEPRFTES